MSEPHRETTGDRRLPQGGGRTFLVARASAGEDAEPCAKQHVELSADRIGIERGKVTEMCELLPG